MDGRVVVREEVEGVAQLSAELTVRGVRVGKVGPEEGNECACYYRGEAIRGEQVDRVVELSVRRDCQAAKLGDFELVPDYEELCYVEEEGADGPLRELEGEIQPEGDEEPEEGDDGAALAVRHVPEGYGCDACADGADEAA